MTKCMHSGSNVLKNEEHTDLCSDCRNVQNAHLLILDIGSGTENPGHVYFSHDGCVHVDIAKDAFHLEMQCDVEELPFSDNCVDMVHASHILEHVTYPYKVLAEIRRVTRKAAIIKVPNASHYRLFSESPEHIYGWTSFNLENLLKRFFRKVEIQHTFRITHESNHSKIVRKMRTLKTYLIAWFFGKNELVAVCFK